MSTAGLSSGAFAGQATGVPTVVEAGEDGAPTRDWEVSPASLALMAGGLVLAAAGISRRLRSRA